MLDDALRPIKERLLAPFALATGRTVSPMAVTLVAFATGLASAWFAARGDLGVGLALWGANRVLDGFDGTLARVQGTQSDFGGYVDLLLDFVVYAVIPVGLALSADRHDTFVAGLWLLASFFVNAASWMYLAALLESRMAGAKARGELTSITMPSGLIAGTETVVLFTAFFVFAAASGGALHAHGGAGRGHRRAAARLGGSAPLNCGEVPIANLQ